MERYEPATASPDLPVVRAWVERNPDVRARLTETTEHGGGRVVLVVSVPDHDDLVRARTEISPLVDHADLLRFRRWQPSEQEAEWTLQWVLGLMRRQRELALPTEVASVGRHVVSGLIEVWLDKVDRDYAAELEARGDGLLFVAPHPDTGVSLAAGWTREPPRVKLP
ncbi:hypothetical protein [Kribbella sp. HUAS MG21]|uniref:Uncharacterized protein n=1 Tax=Kribbella sp. HUAS MG21 TaxID=3160966 RepID=A0AAU7TIS6_9ACTN